MEITPHTKNGYQTPLQNTEMNTQLICGNSAFLFCNAIQVQQCIILKNMD